MEKSPPAVSRGRPRIETEIGDTSVGQPWKELGISERTWWRRKAEAKK